MAWRERTGPLVPATPRNRKGMVEVSQWIFREATLNLERGTWEAWAFHDDGRFCVAEVPLEAGADEAEAAVAAMVPEC